LSCLVLSFVSLVFCLLPFLFLIYVLSHHSCLSIEGAAREARAAAHAHARPRSSVESPRPPLRRSSTSSHTSHPRPPPVTVSRYVSSTFSLSYLFGCFLYLLFFVLLCLVVCLVLSCLVLSAAFPISYLCLVSSFMR
jgi:hypothetical protein